MVLSGRVIRNESVKVVPLPIVAPKKDARKTVIAAYRFQRLVPHDGLVHFVKGPQALGRSSERLLRLHPLGKLGLRYLVEPRVFDGIAA